MANQVFEVQGLKELNENLSKLAIAVEKKLVRKALKMGGAILKAEVERGARRASGGPTYPTKFTPKGKKSGGERGPGHMADHIVMKVSITKKRGAVVKVGPDKDHWYASLQEFGTPNSPADPFMRPALDSKAQEVIDVVAKELGQGIEKEAAKLGAKQKTKKP